MESELWQTVYPMVMDAGKGRRAKRVQHPDTGIVLTYLWAVLHDRPVSWACRSASWPPRQRHRPRPSASTMSRRLRTASVRRLLERVERQLRQRFGTSWCKWIDGRPLPVGRASQDRYARVGYAVNGLAKGYKLYAICDARGGVDAWKVLPMNVAEKRVARHLIRRLRGEGYLVGDTQYDSSRLYDLAARHGFQLVTPRRHGRGLGHCRHSKARLRAIDLLTRPFGQGLMNQRYDIDRFFAHTSNFGAGLAPLPNWVRTLHRVHLWVAAKLILNAVRLTIHRSAAA